MAISELLISFFERIYTYSQPPENVSQYYEEQWDHYKFLIQELFLYTVIVLLGNFQYQKTAELLQSEYFLRNRYQQQLDHLGYDTFRFYLRSLDGIRNERLKLNGVTPSNWTRN